MERFNLLPSLFVGLLCWLMWGCEATPTSSHAEEKSLPAGIGLYSSDAVLVPITGEAIVGKQEIGAYYQKHVGHVDSISQIYRVQANEQYQYHMGIGHISSGGFAYLAIVRDSMGAPIKEFECLVPLSPGAEWLRPIKSALSNVDSLRVEWMKYCNAHDVEGLVRNIYHPQTIYYNHKPIIIGHDKLIATYQYMKNPAYELTLSPLRIEQINHDIIFEIGQCQGSYGGKYIFIWKRDEYQGWKVLVDSNI